MYKFKVGDFVTTHHPSFHHRGMMGRIETIDSEGWHYVRWLEDDKGQSMTGNYNDYNLILIPNPPAQSLATTIRMEVMYLKSLGEQHA